MEGDIQGSETSKEGHFKIAKTIGRHRNKENTSPERDAEETSQE